jgi:hypothetical protein
MMFLLDVPAKGGMHFPAAFTAVYVVGFIAAVSIGSIAWFNSRRPVGWEDADRPNVIPEIKAPEIKTPEEK